MKTEDTSGRMSDDEVNRIIEDIMAEEGFPKAIEAVKRRQAAEATFDAVKWLRDMERYERDNEWGATFGQIADDIERLRKRVTELQGDVKLWKDKWSHATK